VLIAADIGHDVDGNIRPAAATQPFSHIAITAGKNFDLGNAVISHGGTLGQAESIRQ
jgi:hypothetical protein